MSRTRKNKATRLTTHDITLPDVYVAYRKAKAEAYYENAHVHALAFTEYEQQLDLNLRRLHEMLTATEQSWCTNGRFLGGYAYLPKSLDDSRWNNNASGHFRALDPLVDWEQRFHRARKRARAKLRLVIQPTVDFQIISALWIMKVGHRLDSALDSSTAFANRLRRSYLDSKGQPTLRRGINLGTIGIFEPYFSAYRNWRERGLRSIEHALISEKSILAITMDIEQFYHRVNPEFVIRRRFLEKLEIELSDSELLFTKQLLTAISTWYRSTPDYRDRPEGAIPVGLSASKIIANVLLADFDRAISDSIQPIYYGRYVDDIFLVFENLDGLSRSKDVARWLSARLGRQMTLEGDDESAFSLKLNLPYADDSELIFRGSKQRIFALSSSHGLDLIRHIREQIREQSSEYRLLPVVPASGAEMASRALLATPDPKLAVDALRKADAVSVRRLGFSLLLRDLEVFSFDLQPRSWRRVRNEFYALVNRHALSPVGFFEFANYLPRVYGLMISCGDFSAANVFVQRLITVAKLLRQTTTVGVRNQASLFRTCLAQLAEALKQAAIQAATRRTVEVDTRLLRTIRRLTALHAHIEVPQSTKQLRKLVRQVLLADWGSRPYKDYWYLDQTKDEPGPAIPREREIRRRLRIGGIRQFRKLSASLRRPHWPALAFPTRAMRIDEISLVAPDVLANPELFRKIIMILRGAQVVDPSPIGFLSKRPPEGSPQTFTVPGTRITPVHVAVTSFSTTDEQWKAAARGRSDQSWQRYTNVNSLVNRMLQEKPRPDYIVFPELSVPLRWGLRIAQKLASNSISFLAGVEYHHDRTTRQLRNDALVSLITRWPGYASHIVRMQPKFAPAHEEQRNLRSLLHVTDPLLRPTGLLAKPVLYIHRGYCFSVLICSDLTNIAHRNALNGYIDTLFVLEWNKDVKSFSSLVESTALDLHVFVTQANNRQFGDSRVRCPAVDDFRRDVVQVKGGETDFYVIGKIDYLALRKEQRRKVSVVFKPLPIGFQMSDYRRRST